MKCMHVNGGGGWCRRRGWGEKEGYVELMVTCMCIMCNFQQQNRKDLFLFLYSRILNEIKFQF